MDDVVPLVFKISLIAVFLLGGLGIGGVLVRGGARSNNAVVILMGLCIGMGGCIMAWAGFMALVGGPPQ